MRGSDPGSIGYGVTRFDSWNSRKAALGMAVFGDRNTAREPFSGDRLDGAGHLNGCFADADQENTIEVFQRKTVRTGFEDTA